MGGVYFTERNGISSMISLGSSPKQFNDPSDVKEWPYSSASLILGSANRKIDIFKITCKVLLCVGVGLIKKTLAWQQIPCIPCSGKIEKYLQIE